MEEGEDIDELDLTKCEDMRTHSMADPEPFQNPHF